MSNKHLDIFRVSIPRKWLQRKVKFRLSFLNHIVRHIGDHFKFVDAYRLIRR